MASELPTNNLDGLENAEWLKSVPSNATLFDTGLFEHYDWSKEDGDECIRLLEFGAGIARDASQLHMATTLLKKFTVDPAGGILGPRFADYPEVQVMAKMIDENIDCIGRCLATHNLGITNFSLRSIYVLYSLYSLRQDAMYNETILSYAGLLVPEEDIGRALEEKSQFAYQSNDIIRNLHAVDQVVAKMYQDMREDKLSHELIVNVGGLCVKLCLSHLKARRTAGFDDEKTFFIDMRRDKSYQSYEFLLRGVTWPGIVGSDDILRDVITTAELLTAPRDGIAVQQRIIRLLFGRTQVSKAKYAQMHHLMRFALRNPYGVWEDAKSQCLWCGKHHASMRCTHCKVALYCNAYCQKLDWRRAHKPACAMYSIEVLSTLKDSSEDDENKKEDEDGESSTTS
ncbi:unnamed protein product [Peniophora sp. CBMAI 1063]|nr:unnamed protein product [Peniophora sp. CBMAI 1063]